MLSILETFFANTTTYNTHVQEAHGINIQFVTSHIKANCNGWQVNRMWTDFLDFESDVFFQELVQCWISEHVEKWNEKTDYEYKFCDNKDHFNNGVNAPAIER